MISDKLNHGLESQILNITRESQMKIKDKTQNKTIKVLCFSGKILVMLLLLGVTCVVASSPYFIKGVLKVFEKEPTGRAVKKSEEKKFDSAFRYLQRKGLIETHQEGSDIIVKLTLKGKNRAKKYQLDNLSIAIPDQWDGKWRVIIFDIPHFQTTERNAFRRKIRELGFYLLQKSVWVHAFECEKEIRILTDFFGIERKQIQIILAQSIENDHKIKKHFGLT